MILRFRTSIAGQTFAYLEGQTIEVPTPNPRHMDWLRRGIVEALPDVEPETALAPRAIQQAIARRQPKRRRAAKTTTETSDVTDGWSVPVLCPGGTVVCVAGGPSLTPEDVEACRGRATVIAVNDAYRLAPWAEVLYAADGKWWRHHQSALTAFAGLKVSIRVANAGHPADVQLLNRTGDRGLELQPTGLRTGRNSGYQAINLAVHLGATRILLLGYDMAFGPKGESHWFGEHWDEIRPPVATFREFFSTLVEPLTRVQVEILNCSRQTALTCFPRMALDEALSLKVAA